MPFNEEQFDRCSLWLAMKLGRPVTQYDLVKFHVMTDVYHVLTYGRPVIGGPLERWKLGPVVRRAYHRLVNEAQRYERGKLGGPLFVSAVRGNTYRYAARPGATVDEEEFSQSEVMAMEEAMNVVNLSFAASQDFFHDPEGSFMGKVWASTGEGCPIDWCSIIDAYDAQHRTDHTHIKTLIALGV
jgi:hypothetical protein